MNRRLLITLCLAVGLVVSLVLPAQTAKAQAQRPSEDPDALFRFEHFRTAEGLTVDFHILTLLQDRRGFLWIGTPVGLDRYDGYTFTHLLPGASVWTLVEDPQGIIWVGSANWGLSRFDPETLTVTSFRHDVGDSTSLGSDWVLALYLDRAGTLWVGTDNGLARFDQATETFTHFQHHPDKPNSLSRGGVESIYEDRTGVLWIGTTVGLVQAEGDGGLSRFDPATETFTRYQHDPSDTYSLIDNRVMQIKEDRQGTLYVGTCQSGLHRYDRAQDRFERLVADAGDPTRLHAPRGKGSPLGCPYVSIIHEDTTGAFWVGTFTGGLMRFDRDRGTVTHYVHDPEDPYSLSDNGVYSFYEDRQGTHWVGTQSGGLNKLVPRPERWFQPLVFDGSAPNSETTHNVTSLLEDTRGRLWVGTARGALYQLDAATRVPLAAPILLPPGKVDGLYEDRSGMIWAGTDVGLYQVNPETRELKPYVHDPNNPGSLGIDGDGNYSLGTVNSIYEDETGVLWVGVMSGINRLDRSTDTFTFYPHEEIDPGSLVRALVWPILEDRHGILWFGTNSGLSRYDRAQDRFTSFLDDTIINALYEDSKGRFWVGTWGAGLLLFDRTTGASTTFTTAQGLPHNIIGGFREDAQGFLWIITPGGLSRFDPEGPHFVNFTEADGFPNALTNPEPDDFLISKNGDLLIGGNEGVTVVSLDQFTLNPHPPQVVVTGLQIFDEVMAEGGVAPSLELAYHRNDLTFEYVGLHFARPEKNRYAYQLEGYDKEWLDVGTVRTARYTNLDPGHYVFRVKAANSDGVWNETGAAVHITILPPWWLTTGAYLSYGLLFVVGVYVVDRVQRRRLIARERQRADLAQQRLRAEAAERELVQARVIEKAHLELQQSHQHLKATQAQLVQQEKMASLGQLTAGIAHEIKNPLNFVNNFAQLCTELVDELADELDAHHDAPVSEVRDGLKDILNDLKINATKIEEHGKRADNIVKSMLMHSGGKPGERRPTDVNGLLDEYVNLAYHGKRAQVNDFNVTLERDYDEAVGSVAMVPQEIGRVFVNLLNNAFDAVQERMSTGEGAYTPKVSVATRRGAQAVEIEVRDNGSGMSEAVTQKIFEPFFTTKPTGSGTGLGLSMSYDIVVQGHGGTLAVESAEGEGSTFTITIPT